MNPFKNILRLSIGDLAARILSFLAFIYLARTLGVEGYGVIEFALSVALYLQVFTEGGFDLWATRETAQGKDVRRLVAQVVPLRLLLGLLGFTGLVALLPVFPDYANLDILLVLFGLRAFTQAIDLRWVFIGQERMQWVAAGLVTAQIVFAIAVFALVRGPEDVLWVPIFQTAGNLAMAGYFIYRFAASQPGAFRIRPTLRGARQALGPSLTLGTSRGLALLSFNFDMLLIGFLLSATAVGLYGAAYMPVTAILTASATYGLGLFPVLSRAYATSPDEFQGLVSRSLRLTAVLAVPVGIGGTFLAHPGINLLFGPEYAEAATVLQILSWSAVLVILRGTFRQALCAIGRQRVDMLCAFAASAVNISLNIALIPRFGIVGAAAATLVSEVIWISAATFKFSRLVQMPRLLTPLVRPVTAGAVMAVCFFVTAELFWPLQGLIAGAVYLGTLLMIGDKLVRSWVPRPSI